MKLINAREQLREIGFSEQRCNTFLGYLEDFQDSKLEVDAYLLNTKNNHKKSFFRTYFPILTHKKIEAIPEQSKISKPKKKAVLKRKSLHTMSCEESQALDREINERAMEKANKNMHQKIELSDINLEKYAPIANAPCLGCNRECFPESCNALTTYVMY